MKTVGIAVLRHYTEKWGAPPGGEAWTVPYNGKHL